MSLLLADANFEAHAAQVAERVVGVRRIALEQDGEGVPSLDELVGAAQGTPVHEVPPDTLADIYYTGGTTGAPKGVMLSHRTLWMAGVDGCVHTGDLAYRDGDGFLSICDRVKDMVITGGENVFSAEAENAIAAHPAVEQAAVIGVPDETYGERVHAVLVLRNGCLLSQEQLFEHCRSLIANYTTRAPLRSGPSFRSSPRARCSSASCAPTTGPGAHGR